MIKGVVCYWVVSLLVCAISGAAHADYKKRSYVLTSLGISWVKAGNESDFDGRGAAWLGGGYFIQGNAALESSYRILETSTDERSDDVGEYTVSSGTQNLCFGVLLTTNARRPTSIYARAGMSYWQTKLSIRERMKGLGVDTTHSNTIRDEGLGYYLGLGFETRVSHRMRFNFDFTELISPDVFSRSNRAFDLRQHVVSVGTRWLF